MSNPTYIHSDRRGRYLVVPFYGEKVAAGFPSPAEDWLEDVLSLDDLLIRKPAATFLLRVNGTSMIAAGINHDAILIVDRSIEPQPGHVVVAAVDGDFTVKRLANLGNKLSLVPENPEFPAIHLTEDSVIWGVVTAAINQFAGGL